jgi:sugar lactone lactonase YvrE
VWGGFGFFAPGSFNTPEGIAIDSEGNVYITDLGNNRVQKFTHDGAFLAQWGSFGTEDGQFRQPHGIACDREGFVYVGDGINRRIQKFTRDGTFVSAWGAHDGQLDSVLMGVATDASNFVYVVDNAYARIQRFTSDGTFVQLWTTLQYPIGIAVHPDGSVYVTTYYIDIRVQRFTSEGTVISTWPRDLFFADPRGIDVDSEGQVYVVDSPRDHVQKFTADGVLLSQWGSSGYGPGLFSFPTDVAAYGNSVFVVDAGNHQVQRFDYPVAVQGETWSQVKARYRE